MNLSRKHKNTRRRPAAGQGVPVRIEQLPTKPAKAWVATVVTLFGLVGIHVTTGTAQALVMVGQLLLVAYGVWRTTNRPKLPARGTGVQGFLQ